MKLVKSKNMVPRILAKEDPPGGGYGMFNEWDSQNWRGCFETLDAFDTSSKEPKPIERTGFNPFPKELKTEHRFSYFGRTHIPDKE
jgi:hypothetical protein